MIRKFLDEFYETISLENGEKFKAEKFRDFFLPNAILMERTDGEYKLKNIEDHISEFEYAINEYPQLFLKGFHEVQTEFTFIDNDDCILVSSKYHKSYCRNNEDILECGINNIIMVRNGNTFKIATILW